jgi:dihydrodipicolinate synthase/N-acetylneuraminate lyase
MRVDWRGVFPAATTQFADDGSVDLAATGRQLEDTWRARWG